MLETWFSWPSPHMKMGLLRSRSFLAESSLRVTPSKSRTLKGFTTKRGQRPQIFWENIRIFMFVTEPFCPERPAIFEAPEKRVVKHRTEKVEIVGGFTFVPVTIDNLFDPSTSFIAPKLEDGDMT